MFDIFLSQLMINEKPFIKFSSLCPEKKFQ